MRYKGIMRMISSLMMAVRKIITRKVILGRVTIIFWSTMGRRGRKIIILM
jgi:hypothetical protein